MASIALSAVASSRDSAAGDDSSIRADRSPAAIAVAVVVIALTGRTPSRSIHHVTRASTARIAATPRISTRTRREMVASTSLSGSAVSTTDPSSPARARTR